MFTFASQYPSETYSWTQPSRTHSRRCSPRFQSSPWGSRGGPWNTPEEHFGVPFFLWGGHPHYAPQQPCYRERRGHGSPPIFSEAPPRKEKVAQPEPLVEEIDSDGALQFQIYKMGGFEGFELKLVKNSRGHLLKVLSPDGFSKNYAINPVLFDIESISWESDPRENLLVINVPKRRVAAVGTTSREQRQRRRRQAREDRRQVREKRRKARRDRLNSKTQEKLRVGALEKEDLDTEGFTESESEVTTPGDSEISSDEELRRLAVLEEVEDEEFASLRRKLEKA